jgi:hypothetical protein
MVLLKSAINFIPRSFQGCNVEVDSALAAMATAGASSTPAERED